VNKANDDGADRKVRLESICARFPKTMEHLAMTTSKTNEVIVNGLNRLLNDTSIRMRVADAIHLQAAITALSKPSYDDGLEAAEVSFSDVTRDKDGNQCIWIYGSIPGFDDGTNGTNKWRIGKLEFGIVPPNGKAALLEIRDRLTRALKIKPAEVEQPTDRRSGPEDRRKSQFGRPDRAPDGFGRRGRNGTGRRKHDGERWNAKPEPAEVEKAPKAETLADEIRSRWKAVGMDAPVVAYDLEWLVSRLGEK
jgi:hypothetical protein